MHLQILHGTEVVMRPIHWGDELINQFPKLLKDVRYLECSVAWKELLTNMLMGVIRVESHFVDNPTYTPVRFVQIKEKFGGLRAYYDGGCLGNELVPSIKQIVSEAEDESYKTCSKCGSKDGVTRVVIRGWVQNNCKTCKGNPL